MGSRAGFSPKPSVSYQGNIKGCCLYNTPVEHGQFSKTPNKLMQRTRYREPLMGSVRLLKKELR